MTDSKPVATGSLDERFDGLRNAINKIGQQTHAGFAMLVAAALDRVLEEALVAKMVTLNSDMRAKLFGDFGTLSSFSAKIDVAFAIGVADRDTHNRLTTIRKIRNLFAHSNEWLSFESQSVRSLLGEQPGNPLTSPEREFVAAASAAEASVTAATGVDHRSLVERLHAES